MNYREVPNDFSEFRERARHLLAVGADPSQVSFAPPLARSETALPLVFPKEPMPSKSEPASPALIISREKLRWLQTIAMNRAPGMWDLLYRLVWKMHRINKHILDNPADPDVIEGERRAKQVSRDIHKMHAFVRFRKTVIDAQEHFVAWHNPQHKILRAGISFFKKRFGGMNWSILTPDESAHWDTKAVTFTEGVDKNPLEGDEFEAHWLTYYSSIFNPARIKIKAMKKEMPVHYWDSMPETALIPRLLAEAPTRVATMQETARAASIVGDYTSIAQLKTACSQCRACPIACLGGGAVFGEGDESSAMMLVGEQPGDQEDRQSRPFVGPAGQLLDQVLERCQIDRSKLYVTNAVKHFKWTPNGKRRIHQRPTGAEILSCRPWVVAEMHIVKPKVIVCLGASAAQSILGLKVSIKDQLGQMMEGPGGTKLLITYHPSAVLRVPETNKKNELMREIARTMVKAKAIVAIAE